MFTLNCNGRLLTVDKPLVMGIINATPDSFYSSSRHLTIDTVLEKADQMVAEGADIIDIGGQSTRPGSERVPEAEERERVLPFIHALVSRYPGIVISVDTFYASVAKAAVETGAGLINDISAGCIDSDLIDTVAALKVPYVLMHMKGTPESMQQNPVYENVTKEVLDFFIHKTAELKQKGINDIIVDPGFGFGKTIEHNFELLQQLDIFSLLNRPLLAGISRKSTIWRTLGVTAEEALNGTTVLNTVALMKGASVLRVHDVKEAREAVTLIGKLKK